MKEIVGAPRPDGPGPARGMDGVERDVPTPRNGRDGWRDDATLVLLGTACWLVLLGYFRVIGFHWLVSDPRDEYWLKSTELLRLRSDPALLFKVQHRDQVPLYTYLITVVRAVTGSDWPGIMQWITYVAWTGSLVVVRRILRALDVPRGFAMLGAASFGLFPFTGLANAVFPLSDHLALFAIMAGFLAYLHRRPGAMSAAVAVATLTHKFMWPVSGVLVGVGLLRRRVPPWAAAATFVPLGLYWLGAGYIHSDYSRLIRGNVEVGVATARVYPIADGILGSLSESPKDMVQGLFCLAIVVTSAVLCVTRPVRKETALLAFLAPLVLFGLITNQKLIWGLGRYGPLLVVPLFAWLAEQTWATRRWARVLLGVGLVLALATQFAFASYLKSYFSKL